MVHYGHSCLIPVDQTSGIKMLYVFVDIKLDLLHFIETIALNFKSSKNALIYQHKDIIKTYNKINLSFMLSSKLFVFIKVFHSLEWSLLVQYNLLHLY